MPQLQETTSAGIVGHAASDSVFDVAEFGVTRVRANTNQQLSYEPAALGRRVVWPNLGRSRAASNQHLKSIDAVEEWQHAFGRRRCGVARRNRGKTLEQTAK